MDIRSQIVTLTYYRTGVAVDVEMDRQDLDHQGRLHEVDAVAGAYLAYHYLPS